MKIMSRFSKITKWVIWLCAVLFYFYEFILQVSPGVMAHELTQAFNISPLSLGNLSSYYFYSYASMQLLIGFTLDRYGPKKILTLSSLICALGCYLFSSASSLRQAEIGRLIIGIGSSSAVISAWKLTTLWFDKRLFSTITGLTITVGMLGAIFGEAPLAWLINLIGWRKTMEGFSLVGLLLAILIYIIIRERPIVNNSNDTISKNLRKSLKYIISCKQTWLASIYGGLMYAPTAALGTLWGVPWMRTYYGFNKVTAASITSFLFFGWVIGSPLSGLFIKYFGKCKPTMQYGTIFSFLCICILIYIQHLPMIVLMILWFLLGISSSCLLPSLSIIKNLHSQDNVGTALGFGNTLSMLGGAFLQPFIGIILSYLESKNTKTYSVENFMYSLSVIPLFFLLSYYVLAKIKEGR